MSHYTVQSSDREMYALKMIVYVYLQTRRKVCLHNKESVPSRVLPHIDCKTAYCLRPNPADGDTATSNMLSSFLSRLAHSMSMMVQTSSITGRTVHRRPQSIAPLRQIGSPHE